MDASDARTRPKGAFAGRWRTLPLFWKFQIFGWLIFLVASLPLKLVVLGSLQAALVVSLYREGMGFLTTWGMREIYRRWYRPSMSWFQVSLLILLVSGFGAAAQAILALGFHDFIDFEEEKIFHEAAVFAVIYFRVAICLAWSFLYFGIKLWREASDRELKLVTIESERRGAELQKLRAQMNPHFLFNALNSIRAGIGNPKIDLKEVVESLADYLRFSLENRQDDLVPIELEYDAIASYLAVEKARFRSQLEVEMHLAETAKSALVPGIILQPLVENAIRYGWKSSPRPLRINVNIEGPIRKMLKVEVVNTGTWKEPDQRDNLGGIGLGNLRARLRLLYSENHQVLIHAEDGWVTIRMLIPFSYEPADASSRHCR